jgi:hypothetical protein
MPSKPATRWSLFGGDLGGKSNVAQVESRTNLYLEVLPIGEKGQIVAYPTPGLGSAVISNGTNPIRAMRVLNGILYFVAYNNLYKAAPPGWAVTQIMTLATTSGNVVMTDNATQIMFVDGSQGYIYNTQTLVGSIIGDSNFPAGAQTCAYQDGYFIVEKQGSRQFWASQQYDGLTWTPLLFATKEQYSDNIVAVSADKGVVKVWGNSSTEFWNSSGSIDFPYLRIQGTTVQTGLAAAYSLAFAGEMVFFLGKSQSGDVRVFVLDGYVPTAVSTPALDHRIATFATKSDAVGMSYVMDGHIFYQISFPSQGESWLFDYTTSIKLGYPVWTRMKSSGMAMYLGYIAVNLNGVTYIGSASTGKIYPLLRDTYTEDNGAIYREIVSQHLYQGGNRIFLNKLQFEVEVGVGTPSDENPVLAVEVSKDGGYTYLAPVNLTLGGQGLYKTRCQVRRLGMARDWVFRISTADPVKLSFLGADVS